MRMLVIIALILIVYSASPSLAQQAFDVCRGEHEQSCPPHNAHVGCGDPDAYAAQACRNIGMSGRYLRTPLSVPRGGHHCGYATWRYVCQ